jgi:hypothetical protein
MDGMHPQADFIQEGATDLVLYRDNRKLFRGRLGSTQDTLGSPNSGGGGGTDPDVHTVQFSAVDYRAMLGYRIVPDPGWPFTNLDQCFLAYWMIYASQTRGGPEGGPADWGIRLGRYATSVQRTLTESAGTYIGQAINDISNMDGGFDWEIDANLLFNTWAIPSGNIDQAGRGHNIGQVLTYGDNVMSALRSRDVTSYANALRFAGAGALVSNFDIVSAGYATVWPPEGRWEVQDSNTNLTDQASCDNAAKGDLQTRMQRAPSYALTLTHGWWNPDVIWLGDIVAVNIQHGRLNESYSGRVSQIDVYVGDEADEETVVVSVGKRMGSLLRTVPGNSKKMEQIAKRV